jgi:shikimate dehydrogenase
MSARRSGILARVNELRGTTTLVGIIGWPVEHSLSPRMQNAAFAELGLDWAYVPLPTPPERLADAIRGLAALGFAGANVTSPHKLAVAALVETDAASVNTLVVGDGAIEGWTTDAAVLRGLPTGSAIVIGDGGAATAFEQALPHARRFSRRATWPPDARGAELVVNATSERDDVLVELEREQTLIDLPYPHTATAAAARAAGATVVSGLDVLVAQGAASFELWTGMPAPVDAMRRALGFPA